MLKSLSWPDNRVYKTGSSNEPFKFYLDCLLKSNSLDLLLGYFSSSAINVLSIGFASFISRGGTVRLIINDILFEDDKKAILNGEGGFIKDDLIDLNDYASLKDTLSRSDQFFFDCLAWLISKNRLQFVIIRPKNSQGISHFKSGIFSDGSNRVGFKASCNFTATALLSNLEELTVIDPNDGEIPTSQLDEQIEYFNKIYSGKSDVVEYLPTNKITEAIKSIGNNKGIEELIIDEQELIKLKRKTDIYHTQAVLDKIEEGVAEYHLKPKFPFIEGPRDYQKEAYENWLRNDKKGLFAMATGTGKTITSLNCVLEEYKKNPNKTYRAFILAPTITLVDQWEKEALKFNFKNIIKVSSRSDWRSILATRLRAASRIHSSFIIISTYATFGQDRFQRYVSDIPEDTIFIADEAHNMGSKTVIEKIDNIKLEMRIGLSATPKRVYDPDGTKIIEDFFNDSEPFIVSYSMEKAINNNVLTKYDYYPHIVKLTTEELENYIEISREIARQYFIESNISKNNKLEMLLLARKRIIHKAVNKLPKAEKILRDRFKKEGSLKFTFIYVPEGLDPDISELNQENEDEAKIINQYLMRINSIDEGILVNKVVGGMKNRDQILDQFSRGEISVLASMKCLDEGVDIPRAEHAIFCSSTGNPRQFIQRRGRVLRKHVDKTSATVHDLVVIPILDTSDKKSFEIEKNLVENELKRVMYFASLSKNPNHSFEVFSDICEYYDIDIYSIFNDLKDD